MHSHPCERCLTAVDCYGPMERNYDGWPEVVCVPFDVDREPVVCEICRDEEEQTKEPEEAVG